MIMGPGYVPYVAVWRFMDIYMLKCIILHSLNILSHANYTLNQAFKKQSEEILIDSIPKRKENKGTEVTKNTYHSPFVW